MEGNMVGFLLTIGIAFIASPLIFLLIYKVYIYFKKKKIKEKDMAIREYFKNFKDGDKLAVIDETPRPVYIGNRFYMISPLKYRQFTRICILFASVMHDLNKQGINPDNMQENFDKVIAAQEDEFFRCLAFILYFSRNEKEDNEANIMIGVDEEYKYLKDCGNINEISRLLEIIVIQNDISRALSAFGNLAKKKPIAGG